MSDDDELLARAWDVLQRRARGASSASTITVRQLFEKYEAANRTRKSWASIEVHMRATIAHFADREVGSLRVIDWTEYRAKREQELVPGGKGRTYSPTTINTQLTYFKTLANWGVLQGLIPGNPISGAKRSKQRAHRETAPVENEISELLGEASPMERAIVLCAADAGMRRSEIRSLSWSWIDFDARVIHLANWACKNGRGGPVPATQRLLDAIEAIPRALRSPFVFTSPVNGEQYSPRHFSRLFRELADKVGLKAAPGDRRVVLHDARHAYASNATRRGVRIEIVSKVLRHASLDQTRDYVQTADADFDVAREMFEAGIARDSERRGPRRAPIDESISGEKEKGKG